jgi:uncharacterized protein
LENAPVILVFGLNYPDNRILGVFIFTVSCILISPLFTKIRQKGNSVFAAGILHGTLNTVAPLTVISLSSSTFPWAGMVGIGGFAALLIPFLFFLLADLRARRDSNPRPPA